MSDIKFLIDKQKHNEEKLVGLFVNYCGKYMRKMYNSFPKTKAFLKSLLDILNFLVVSITLCICC